MLTLARRGVVLGAMALLVPLLSLPPAQGVPPGWTEPDRVPGTAGIFNHLSATAPDGTDLVVWIDPGSGSGYEIKARLRRPGANSYRGVASAVEGLASVQDLVLASTKAGDFWLAYTRYAGTTPTSYVTKLDSDRRSWSKPKRVFTASGYHFRIGSLAVSGTGTVVAGASGIPDVSTSPPTYRAAVGTLAPGASGWQTRFVSPSTTHAGSANVAAGPRGHLAASYIRGYALAEMTVFAASRAPSNSAPWRVRMLSATGDSQRVSPPAVGADGSAAVTWLAPASGPWPNVRLASGSITRAGAGWTAIDLQTGGGPSDSASVVVAPSGAATAIWHEGTGGGAALIRARRVVAGVPGPLMTLSSAGQSVGTRDVGMRNDGRVAMLFQQFTTGGNNLGMRYTLIDGDTPGAAEQLTDGTEEYENQERLGLTAAGRASVVYTRGFTTSDVGWFGQTLVRPKALKGAFGAKAQRSAKVKGKVRLGRRVRCAGGFWVETSSLAFSWRRDGRRISGADKAAYRPVTRDLGRRLSCRIVARNEAGSRALSSKGYVVRR